MVVTHEASRVILMNKPIAALDVAETERLETLILRLAERGTAVLLTSHNMTQVFRVVVLRRGVHVANVNRSDVTESDVVALITGAKTFAD
jgi:ABC-type sugar transport system ATPase subunit